MALQPPPPPLGAAAVHAGGVGGEVNAGVAGVGGGVGAGGAGGVPTLVTDEVLSRLAAEVPDMRSRVGVA